MKEKDNAVNHQCVVEKTNAESVSKQKEETVGNRYSVRLVRLALQWAKK